MKPKKSLGQIAFEEYYPVSIRWNEAGYTGQLHWREVANAVAREVRKRMKEKAVVKLINPPVTFSGAKTYTGDGPMHGVSI